METLKHSDSRRNFLVGLSAIPLVLATGPTVRRSRTNVPSKEFVIEAGYTVLENGDTLSVTRDVSILVKGDIIVKVVAGRIPGTYTRIDATGDIVLPGFISGHSHALSGPVVKGLLDTGRSYRPPEKLMEDLSQDDLEAIAALCIAELLISGCTTMLEQSLSLKQMKAFVTVAERWGVRAYPGAMTPSMNRVFELWKVKSDQALFDSVPETLKEIDANLAFGIAAMNKGEGRIKPMTSPHGTDTNTPETLKALKHAADTLGTGFHMHLAQSGAERDLTKRLWGKEPLQLVLDHGFLEGPFFAAHMSAMNWDTDPAILKQHGGVITLCPLIGSPGGVQPLTEVKAAGIPLNLGIDSPINNYLETVRMAVIMEKVKSRYFKNDKMQGHALSMMEAIDSATRIPARGLRRDDLGIIKAGAKADLICINLDRPPVGPGILPVDPLSSLLYANSASMRCVMTDGVIQMYQGAFVLDDLTSVSRKAGRAVQKIWDTLRTQGYFG